MADVFTARGLRRFRRFLSSRFDLDLPEAGLLVSLVEVGGASLGFVAGMALAMIGAGRALVSGLVLLAVTTVIEAVAGHTSILFAARGLPALVAAGYPRGRAWG